MSVQENDVVIVEKTFNVPVPKVFEALKEGRLFFNCGAWPEKSTVDFRIGGKYRFDWGHHGSTYGEFTEIVPNKRLAFTWNSDEMEVKGRVAIDLMAEGNSCKLKLKHEGFVSSDQAEMHDWGWNEGLSGFGDEVTNHVVRIEREFEVPVEMLFEACAGMHLFSNLGLVAAKSKVDFKVGGKYSCVLENGNSINGEFLEIEKNKKIVFTWEKAPCGTHLEKNTQVSMEFGPWGDDGKNSYVALVHTGFVSDDATRTHHTGWNFALRKIYDRAKR